MCVDQVVKTYGRTWALRGVSSNIFGGEITVIFGANGAGKSTILRIIAGLIRPDSGTVTVNGFDTVKEGPQARSQIGVALHSPMLYSDLTLEENLVLTARLFQLPNPKDTSRAAVDRVGLSNRLDERVRRMSRGMIQRAAIARAIMHNPEILVLDEPETGLDAESTKSLDKILEEQKSSGASALMTSHFIERGLEVADTVIVMRRGKVVLHGKRGTVSSDEIREIQQEQR